MTRPHQHRGILVAALAIVFGLGLGAPAARAQVSPVPAAPSAPAPAAARGPDANCTVTVVHATQGAGGVDGEIQDLRKYLLEPPFNSWKRFIRLESARKSIEEGKSENYASPGGTVTVRYKGHLVHEGKHAVQGVLDVKGPKMNSSMAFTLDEGKVLLTAGQKHADGILIYALRCTTH